MANKVEEIADLDCIAPMKIKIKIRIRMLIFTLVRYTKWRVYND